MNRVRADQVLPGDQIRQQFLVSKDLSGREVVEDRWPTVLYVTLEEAPGGTRRVFALSDAIEQRIYDVSLAPHAKVDVRRP